MLECSDWLKAKLALGQFLPDVEYEWPPTADWSKDKNNIPRPDGFGMEGYKKDDNTF